MSWTLRTIYALGIIAFLLFSSAVTSVYAWRNRTDTSSVVFFGLSTAFFLYVAGVLLAQGITRLQYRRAARRMGLAPFNMAAGSIQVLPAVMEGRSEGYPGDSYHGEIDGLEAYIFNYSHGPAWWNKTRTFAVVRHKGFQRQDLAQLIDRHAKAELIVDKEWLLIRARKRIPANDLRLWLLSISAVLRNSKS